MRKARIKHENFYNNIYCIKFARIMAIVWLWD